MADSFFGFDTSATGQGLDDGIDCPIEEEEIAEEEEEYDALNDETFGSEATAGDWERDHEKLAQITESGRLQHYNTSSSKNGIDIDIEDNLSHLVLDEKDGIVPRPGVWDSPQNLPVQRPKASQTLTSLKNVCTVEELERGLIINRPPPGLSKPPLIQQQQQHLGGQFLFDSLSLGEQQLNLPPNLLNGLPSPPCFPPGLGLQGPHPVVPPPTLRLPHPQFMQNPRGLPNQTGNMLRYPLPPPHLMIPHGNQRQQPHGTFFPPPPHPSLGPPQFLRPSEHPMLSQFSNNHPMYSHHQQQQQQHHQQQQQQQQQNQQQREQHQQHGSNQRKQNRPYQQNDQQGPHQPFFKDNQYPYQNRNNQRYNQQHHHHSQSMNGLNESGDYDEYAGLMTSREKQWLTNLQLLQHNTNQPYVDDYYYTVYCQRLNKKNENQEQREKKHHNNNGYHRDSKDRDQSQHVFTTKVIYTPTQFENSLGKLQCGSVTAPRKIIDMDVVPNSDPHSNPPPQAKETKKTRQRLLEIERLYTIQLKLEDANNPLALLAEQQQQTEEGEPKPVKKTPRELINALLTSLLQLLEEDKLASILSIRKGKTLLLRFLPYLSVTEYSKQLEELWVGLIRNLAIIGRRDPNLLTRFFPEFHNWLETVPEASVLVRIARSFTESLNHNTKTNSLSFAVTNKFGVSVMASMLEQAENVVFDAKQQAAEWSNFIVSMADAIGSSPPSVAPCHPIAANTLNEHLNRIGNLSTERYAPLELLLTDANPSR